jgi:hypothetical protein
LFLSYFFGASKMYCPICGQQQVSDLTRFCSRCGFLLTGVAQVIANNGNVPFIQPTSSLQLSSPRKKGIKFGGALMLSGIILTPVAAILTDDLRIGDYVVPLIAILTFLGGLLSMIFSLLFFSGSPKYFSSPDATSSNNLQNATPLFQSSHNKGALPPQSANFNPVGSAYTPPAQQPNPVRGNWRDPNTNELVMQPSVTEETTKLLEQQKPK